MNIIKTAGTVKCKTFEHIGLEPTGKYIATITSSPTIWVDNQHQKYFIKDDQKQFEQVVFLKSIGIPVPQLLVADSLGHYGSCDSGIPLSHLYNRYDIRELFMRVVWY
jgi:hypothetical protein